MFSLCQMLSKTNKAGQKIKVSPSAIRDNINQSGHAASLEDFLVLDIANNDFDLLIHESLLILHDRPSLNSQQSSIPLVLFYALSFGLAPHFTFHVGIVITHFSLLFVSLCI